MSSMPPCAVARGLRPRSGRVPIPGGSIMAGALPRRPGDRSHDHREERDRRPQQVATPRRVGRRDGGHELPGTFRHSYSRDRAQLLRRLSRIEGQVRGIARMIEREEYCVDILQQTSALRAAVDAVSLLVLEDHVQGCIRTAVGTRGRAAVRGRSPRRGPSHDRAADPQRAAGLTAGAWRSRADGSAARPASVPIRRQRRAVPSDAARRPSGDGPVRLRGSTLVVDGRLRPTIHDSVAPWRARRRRRRRRVRTAGATSGATRTRPSTRSARCWPARSTSWPDRARPTSTSPASSRSWPESSGARRAALVVEEPTRSVTVAVGADEAGRCRPAAGSLARRARTSLGGAARSLAGGAHPRGPCPARRRAPARAERERARCGRSSLVPVVGEGGVHLGVELPPGTDPRGGRREAPRIDATDTSSSRSRSQPSRAADERERPSSASRDAERTGFVSMVAHELRTPLTGLGGYLDLLLDGRVTDPGVEREFLERSRRMTEGMAELVG